MASDGHSYGMLRGLGVVPYISSGAGRRMAARALTSSGSRNAGGRYPQRLHGLGCGCGGGCGCGSKGLQGLQGGGGVAPAPGPGLVMIDPYGLPYVPYRAARVLRGLGLGFLGDSNALEAAAAGGAAKYGATVGTTSLLTAAGAGAVAGPVGIVVGVVVGLLTSKLFGKANQAQIANDVATRLKYAEAYKQVAGLYPGRVYGVNEVKQVWYGLVHEGVFPKNWGGGTCDVNACISGIRSGGKCPNCGGQEQWVDDLFSGALANPTQGFNGAIKAAGAVTNPVQIADNVLIPAWSGPDPNKFNIKWAYPGNSTNASLVRQLMIDSLDAVEYAANPNLPVYYGSVPGQQAPPPAAPAPPPAVAVTPTGAVIPQVTVNAPVPTPVPGNPTSVQTPVVTGTALCPVGTVRAPGGQCILPNQCPAPYVSNGTQCVLPSASQQTGPAPPSIPSASAPPSAAVPSSYNQVGTDANGVPVFANAQGVLYQYSGTGWTQFTGQLQNPASQQAALQAAIQAALAQGYSQQQAAAAALASQQSAGASVPPALVQSAPDQAAAAAAAPQSTPVAAAGSTDFFSGNTGLVAIAVAVIGFGFVTAHPKKGAARRSRRRG